MRLSPTKRKRKLSGAADAAPSGLRDGKMQRLLPAARVGKSRQACGERVTFSSCALVMFGEHTHINVGN